MQGCCKDLRVDLGGPRFLTDKFHLGIRSRLEDGRSNPEYHKARMALLKDQRVCTRHPNIRAVEGKTLCRECLHRSLEVAREIVSRGMCRSHPARMSTAGRTYCQECLMRRKQRSEMISKSGMCSRHPFQKAAAGNLVCQTCIDDAENRLRKARLSGTCRIHPRRKAVVNNLCRECYEAALGRNSNRYRNLSFDAVFGSWFEASARHHITPNAIAFIPITLHRSIPHSFLRNRNMDLINKATVEFYNTKDPLVAKEIMEHLRSYVGLFL